MVFVDGRCSMLFASVPVFIAWSTQSSILSYAKSTHASRMRTAALYQAEGELYGGPCLKSVTSFGLSVTSIRSHVECFKPGESLVEAPGMVVGF